VSKDPQQNDRKTHNQLRESNHVPIDFQGIDEVHDKSRPVVTPLDVVSDSPQIPGRDRETDNSHQLASKARKEN
jgi:hypothetical protein